ncbi:hypothetical protein JD969_10655 [Planctomycetota bacterium]|nr:hypothetical protein JD969_10655 [Planctomycetota bacterium]
MMVSGNIKMNNSINEILPVKSIEKIYVSENDVSFLELSNSSGLTFKFFDTGVIYNITCHSTMINLLHGDPFAGMVSCLYIRKYINGSYLYHPMIGNDSASIFRISENAAMWSGQWEDITYSCKLKLHATEPSWCWSVEVKSTESFYVDVVYIQDVSIADRARVTDNEAYISQYIDHKIYDDEKYGPILVSRQNADQSIDSQPKLVQACISGAQGCLTDGYDIWGTCSRTTGQIQSFEKDNIGCHVRQYEMACAAIQSEKYWLTPNQKINIIFASVFLADNQSISSRNDCEVITNISDWANAPSSNADLVFQGESKLNWPIVQSEELTDSELKNYFSLDWRLCEIENNQLLSFFYDDDKHVVLKSKELLTERPHGHIIRVGESLLPHESDICLTSWMCGSFISHLACGNTSFHKFISILRNPLDILRTGGLRLLVMRQNGWECLGVPSAFEMSRSSCRWIYKLDDRVIEILVSPVPGARTFNLTFKVLSGSDIAVSALSQFVMGATEWRQQYELEVENVNSAFIVRSIDVNPINLNVELPTYRVEYKSRNASCKYSSLESWDTLSQVNNYPHHVIESMPTTEFQINFTVDSLSECDKEQNCAHNNWSTVNLNSNIQHEDTSIQRLNDIMKWYSHNALIHLTSPHGLEQYSGAAWGVRDVCQGPVEYLTSINRYQEVKEILRIVFAQQYYDSGNWPQWFMFDEYSTLRDQNSHGDIVVWPLKALCDYIEGTSDWNFLDDLIDFTDDITFEKINEHYPLLYHVKRTIERIESEFIQGTCLIRYGDGDWNDSLQPAQKELRNKLVSSWTVEILYQTLNRLILVLKEYGHCSELVNHLESMVRKIQSDFQKNLVCDNVVCGFAKIEDNGQTEHLLHPNDNFTGIKHRLLPYTRGIISEIFTPSQAQLHDKIIQEKLLHPDGVRLMDRPVRYSGGKQNIFCRAESAASFSREISLQYVHAHLRYCEAMAKLGRADALYHGLNIINPIGLNEILDNVNIRQSNSYFSSSEGDFLDRYQSENEFEKLKAGEIMVKSGWRIYSSGPGIYYGMVVQRMLGLRFYFGNVIIDPVLPVHLTGLRWSHDFMDCSSLFIYKMKNDQSLPQTVRINGTLIKATRRERNRYRYGGMMIPVDTVRDLLQSDNNVIEIN